MGSVTVGDRSSFTGIMIVTPRHTAPNLDDTWRGFKDLPLVFATAMMCGFIEQTCIEAFVQSSGRDGRVVEASVEKGGVLRDA
jgi:fluoroacetyl-CoA thioesterase